MLFWEFGYEMGVLKSTAAEQSAIYSRRLVHGGRPEGFEAA